MTDRIGFILWPVIFVLVGCAAMARTDAAILGTPAEPLESGQRYFVQAFDRATVMARCAKIASEFGKAPLPAHACTYQRAGDTVPTIIISLDDMGPIQKHEIYHVRQLDRGETPSHEGWK